MAALAFGVDPTGSDRSSRYPQAHRAPQAMRIGQHALLVHLVPSARCVENILESTGSSQSRIHRRPPPNAQAEGQRRYPEDCFRPHRDLRPFEASLVHFDACNASLKPGKRAVRLFRDCRASFAALAERQGRHLLHLLLVDINHFIRCAHNVGIVLHHNNRIAVIPKSVKHL